MESTRIKLSELEPNAGQVEGLPVNPRQWTKGDVTKLAKSLKETPELFEARPIIVYPHGGKYVILGGNMRYEACRENKDEDAPCVIVPEDTPVQKLKEIVIKDNGTFGAWDYDALANEWDDLPLAEFGVPAWNDAEAEEEPEPMTAEEDDFDEDVDEVPTKCKRGDVWILGNHRLMCGDSTSPEDVAILMDGVKADMVFTDPPYNVAIGSKNAFLNAFGIHGGIQEDIIGDKGMTDEEIGKTLWLPAFKNLYDASKDSAPIYVTMPQGGTHMMMMMMIAESGWKVKHELIWVKSSPTFSMNRLNYDYQHEPIMYGWKKTHEWYGKGQFDKSVWQIAKPQKSSLHPTMKPIELIANALLNSSKSGDNIIDVFGGSGSTLIACEQLNRKCYMMELDTHYCDVIIARWEKHTGQKAVPMKI